MTVTGPDVHQLRHQELPQLTFPGGGRQPFRVAFVPEIHARIWQHAGETKAVEICGVLVGQWGRDGEGPFVSVTETVRGEAATNKFAEVTFTHETWARINQEMDTKFSHLAIVGWYHSHPDFGIFLSDRDQFIQQHFFSGPGQLAYVVDPVREAEGVFIWRDGKPVLAPFYWVGDRPLGSERATRAGTEAKAGTHAAPSTVPPGASWWETLLPWLALLCLFLLGWLGRGVFQTADQHRIQREALAETALWLGVKPGLKEGLDRSLTELEAAAKEVDALAKAHPPAEGDEGAAQRAQWEAARRDLAKARQHVRVVQADYCLTPAQTERLLRRTANVLAALAPGLSREERARMSQRLEKELLQDMLQGRPTPPANGDSPAKKAEAEKAGEDRPK